MARPGDRAVGVAAGRDRATPMLTSLAIRDIVLIERLDLAFEPGLCVLTGETGAGKSILLDALGLALGGRADRDLVRRGAAQASVSAVFAPAAGDPVQALLAEQGIAAEDDLVLRRVVGADGRSRGFVNDQPVGTGLMRQIGGLLIEVHGQHEQQGLFDPAIQRGLLDAYGGLEGTARGAAPGAWRAGASWSGRVPRSRRSWSVPPRRRTICATSWPSSTRWRRSRTRRRRWRRCAPA